MRPNSLIRPQRVPARLVALAIAGLALLVMAPAQLTAQEAPGARLGAAETFTREDYARLFDAMVERVDKSFWDKDRLASTGWERLAQALRPGVIEATNLEEAVRRINALLGQLKTSHTGLLTPDDQDYYNLLDVFSNSRGARSLAKQYRSGVHYAGIGIFSVRIDERQFRRCVLEGTPAERAGLKVGDEIVSVDGAAFHPIRSFRGRIGQEAPSRSGVHAMVPSKCCVSTCADRAAALFNDATLASARVHRARRPPHRLRACVGLVRDQSTQSLKAALAKLNVEGGVARAAKTEGGDTAVPRSMR
jgi:hypothetical protein